MTLSNIYDMTGLKNDLLLKVFNRVPVPRVPVWMMRQAGRSDPEYRKLRQSDGRPLEELFLDVEMSLRISLLPERFGVDAIIMFQDILTPLAPMGAGFRFIPSPVLDEPIRTAEQVRGLHRPDPESELSHVGELLRGLQNALQGSLPVLGFAGAPMTLAFFLIAGKSPNLQVPEILSFIEENPVLADNLLNLLTDLTIDYLNYQISSGVHAVQLFESFADVFPRPFYERYVQQTHERIFASLDTKTPAILFARECTHLDLMAKSGATALSLGNCIDLGEARQQFPELVLQGNVDNRVLRDGNPEEITESTRKCLKQTGGVRHILNLNHGLLAETPFENVLHFVECAKTHGQVSNIK